MSDEVERTLCQLPHVHVFRIPTRKSAEGHRASDFPKDPVWTGKCKIVAKGRVAGVILVDAKNDVFAHCVVNDDGAVERTLDSGRYFVLRITNPQGRHAFIGIAFNERNDAFDFNVALSEFKREQEREDMAAQMADVPVGQMRDMSLKEGEKIKIKI
ncbi:adaptin ear-binding coat-associated protein 1 NECAP-1, partial [Ochromonadaceae sp. CCMP2298]